uniref:Annexin A4 n=1 Tax=Hippocampus comes TaxID=109280 RepID=A0A3Q2Y672_HIPCM
MAAIGNRGTVTEASGFDPEADAQKLHQAMKGNGTDEAVITEILPHRTIAQRQHIKEAFKQAVGKGQFSHQRSSLHSNGCFGAIIVFVLHNGHVVFVCFICVLAEYGKDLEEDVRGGTSGMFQRVLISLVTPGRNESDSVDEAQVVQDAKDLYDAGEARWGTDEVKFLTVLCVRNQNHLLRVFEEYKKISGRDIEESIKREMSGSLADVFLAIVKCVKNKHAFFAERLYESMKGLGLTDTVLNRIMVSRAEIDMLDIKAQFLNMYGESLPSFIQGDTSGDYRKILLELCGGD